jgi:hypothetical protein
MIVVRKNFILGAGIIITIIGGMLLVVLLLAMTFEVRMNQYDFNLFSLMFNRIWFITGPGYLFGVLMAIFIAKYQVNPNYPSASVWVIKYFYTYQKENRSPWLLRFYVLIATFLTLVPILVNYFVIQCSASNAEDM